MPPIARSRSRRPDTKQSLYDITIAGTYFAPSDTSAGLIERPYEVTVKMNDELVTKGPLSVWKNALAPELMPKLYPDYQGLATHEIILTVPVGGGPLTDLRLMNREQLSQYITDNELPVDVDLYSDVASLRQAVEHCEKDLFEFEEQQETLRSKVGDTIAMKNEAQALNPPSVIEELAKNIAAEKKQVKKDKLADL